MEIIKLSSLIIAGGICGSLATNIIFKWLQYKRSRKLMNEVNSMLKRQEKITEEIDSYVSKYYNLERDIPAKIINFPEKKND